MAFSFANFLKAPKITADLGITSGFSDPKLNQYLTGGNGSELSPFELTSVSVTAKSPTTKTTTTPTVVSTKLDNSNLLLLALVGAGLIIISKS